MVTHCHTATSLVPEVFLEILLSERESERATKRRRVEKKLQEKPLGPGYTATYRLKTYLFRSCLYILDLSVGLHVTTYN